MSDDHKPQLPALYEVGFGKPPVSTRFQKGVSGNPQGRPRGRKSKIPRLQEERLKTIILQEAYRDIPIQDRGRTRKIPLITANIRALALNGAKGNNRAANIFTSAVQKIEADNKKLVMDAFGSACDYKRMWNAELERRRRLRLTLPDPVPHPDDIILDVRDGTVHYRGPRSREEFDLYEMGETFIEVLQEQHAEMTTQLAAGPSETERDKLLRKIDDIKNSLKTLMRQFGPPEIRRASPAIREMEDLLGTDLTGWSRWGEEEADGCDE